MLHGRKVLIGITGGIAAYKITFLVRLLIKNGAEVRVILTPSATDFVTPLTLSTLSRNPVYSDYFDAVTGEWHSHVELGLWADIMLIAPLTANTLSKMTHGQADNLLLATYLSAKCPVVVAPAMDLDMYAHPTTKHNLKKLKEHDVHVIEAESGELASGLSGEGRMAEPETISNFVLNYFKNSGKLKGKKILITAGPTRESIDPVRYIGNRSSGKMGYALAAEAVKQGGNAVLVSGPTNLDPPEGVKVIQVQTAEEMYKVCIKEMDYDIAVLAAAVSDYKVENVAENKIKKDKNTDSVDLHLVQTKDILLSLGNKKKEEQFLVGFALESENELDNARKKLEKKNLDLIVLNSIRDEGATFGSEKNKITILDKSNKTLSFELKDKSLVARDIFDVICDHV